jgi:hypothetical protein
VDFIEEIIGGVEPSNNTNKGRSLEFLPKTLEIISKLDSIPDKKDCTGLMYKDEVLRRICDLEWPTNVAAKMIEVLRDIPMTQDQLRTVINTIAR